MATKKLRLQVVRFAFEALSGSCNCVHFYVFFLSLSLFHSLTLVLIRSIFLSLSPFFHSIYFCTVEYCACTKEYRT